MVEASRNQTSWKYFFATVLLIYDHVKFVYLFFYFFYFFIHHLNLHYITIIQHQYYQYYINNVYNQNRRSHESILTSLHRDR